MQAQARYKPGERIGGRYQVHKALMGGMGEVYLCLDLEEMHPYALKTFQQRYLTDAQRLRRAFEQEVATWVALEKHPNIVRCFYMDMLDNQPFMVLEWIAGEEDRGTDLRSWLRHGSLELRLALEVSIDICHGLIHAQTKRPGLVHRDLKPENILMGQSGLAKITDFGLAEITQTTGLELDIAVTARSDRQSMFGGQGITGTPAYMAPEQWRNEPLDQRTDIYALGCILYELLTGVCPFQIHVPATIPDRVAVWLRSLQQLHEQEQAAPLPNMLPLTLNSVLQRCLAKAPTARYTDIADLLSHLTAIYQAHFDQPPPTRSAPASFTAVDYNNRGMTYANLQKYEAALADFTHALTVDFTYAQTYYNRGAVYAALQKYEAALADYNQSLTLDPNYTKAYYSRGNTYRALQKYEAALADYNQALTLDPNYAKAYAYRGAAYAALQKYEAALADYNQALTIDPNHPAAYLNIGLLLTNQGRLQEALPYFEKAAQRGDMQGAQYATRVRQMLDMEPPPMDLAQQAFDAFLQADSAEAMRQTVAHFPLLAQPNFIAVIEQTIAQYAPPEQRPAFAQRLAWLRQIADTQNPRSTP